MRIVFRRGGGRSDEADRAAAVGVEFEGTYEPKDLILGLAVHIVVVGMPIAYCTKRFGS